VTLNGQTPTRQHGGSGSTSFEDVCPDGQVVVGYLGNVDPANDIVGRIQTVCGQLTLNGTGPYHITTSPGATLTERGSRDGIAWTQTCPTNQVVVGCSGLSGRMLDHVVFDCAPLNVTMGQGRYFITLGARTTLDAPGGYGGGSSFAESCPSGGVARGSAGTTSGSTIYSFGLICSTPVLTGL
jgi:hypothetical protein